MKRNFNHSHAVIIFLYYVRIKEEKNAHFTNNIKASKYYQKILFDVSSCIVIIKNSKETIMQRNQMALIITLSGREDSSHLFGSNK